MPCPPLSKRVHDALKGLCCLARAHRPVRAHEVAQCAGIPPAQAAKMLYLLTWKGFLGSRRGSKGGFWLRVPADRIRVRDVVEFFHPPVDRRVDRRDPVLRVWRETAGSSHQAFEQLTLADLLAGGKAAQPLRALLSPEGDWPLCP